MTDHLANLRDLVGVLQTIAKLAAREADAVEHQLRDYEAALDVRTDRQQSEVVF